MTTTRHYLARTVSPPIDLIRPDSWRDRAACHDHQQLPASAWDDSVHGETDRSRARRIAAAIAVCGTCPVRDACLADVDPRFDEGVRGAVDLRAHRRNRRKAMPA